MITLPQLKMLAKQNNICYSNKNKDELIALLIDNEIIMSLSPKVTVNTVKRNYDHLKGNRNNPKTVEVFDKKTGKTSIFPSKYKAGRALEINPGLLVDGVTLKNRYVITI